VEQNGLRANEEGEHNLKLYGEGGGVLKKKGRKKNKEKGGKGGVFI